MILIICSVLCKLLAIACLFLGIRWLLFHTSLLYILKNLCRRIEDWFHVYQSFKVHEFNENLQENLLYRKVDTFVNSLTSIEDSNFTSLFSSKKPNEILLELEPNQIVHDTFLGSKVTWMKQTSNKNNTKTFVLKIRKHDKRRVLRSYLQYIHTVSDEIEAKKRKELKLYIMNNTNSNSNSNSSSSTDSVVESGNQRWRSVPFNHPTTMETIAMDADLKNKVRSDLETFLKSKQYYHRLGRVWKRSYLLYGPSGTGKSSFIAAMANHLNYDIYDVDLSKLRNDSDLKLLLLQTTNRSIVVIEDFDRFLIEKSRGLSSSGVLNFMDGLLSSCCGDERVMVYTMGDKERVDSSILRPGRIDVHLHFPLCDFNSFKILASNYLGVKEHKLFPQVEEIFTAGVSLSQAEIGEIMIVNRNSPSRAIKTVIGALQINGDGRGVGKIGRRGSGVGSETESRNSADQSGELSGVGWKEGGVNSVKEFRKLCDFLMMKGCRKSGPFDVLTSVSQKDHNR